MTNRTRRSAATHVHPAAPGPSLPFHLFESKLHPPPPRDGIVARPDLVCRLGGGSGRPVVAIVAPAGYGKSTLLAQWAQEMAPRVGWVSVDARDNDPAVLLAYLAVALDRIEPIEPSVFQALATPGSGIVDVARLVESITAMREPVALALDNADVLSRARRDVIAELAVCLPAGSRLAIASRRDVPVPVARLRAQDAIIEVGADALAMDRDEAAALLSRAGVELSEPLVAELCERSEGWPAGLYLAALAIQAGSPGASAAFKLTGDDRYIDDYLRAELLSRLSPAEVSFLTRTSVLDRLCGSLCDAVTGRRGSGAVLDRLEQNNLFVVPLDRHREWYRYHHLFRELLHSELLRREADTVPVLCRRAADWHERNELPEVAIDYSQRGDDAERVARLVLAVANPVWSSGRADTVVGWMEWFATHGLVEQYPAIAVHGSLMYALAGRAGDADRWAAAAERSAPSGVSADGNTMEASLAYLRTLLCRDGLDEMCRDARLALQGLSPTSPYRAAMLHAQGLHSLFEGRRDEADGFFVQALEEATSAGVVPFVPVLLAERGLVAIDRNDWVAAEALAEQALMLMAGGQFDDYWTCALVFAWAARTAAHRGDVAQAGELAARAARLRPLLTHAIPIVATQALVELARTYIALGDAGGAGATLEQIDDIVRHRPKIDALAVRAEEIRQALDRAADDRTARTGAHGFGPSSLTTAELRVLRLLPTHLSIAEIAERLFVSRNTVKSQTIAIYRKLGTSSRSGAVEVAFSVGLVEPSSLAVHRLGATR